MQLARVAAGAARQSVQQQVSRCNVFAVRAMSTSHTFAIEEAKVWGGKHREGGALPVAFLSGSCLRHHHAHKGAT